jgi:hypothetical protein
MREAVQRPVPANPQGNSSTMQLPQRGDIEACKTSLYEEPPTNGISYNAKPAME